MQAESPQHRTRSDRQTASRPQLGGREKGSRCVGLRGATPRPGPPSAPGSPRPPRPSRGGVRVPRPRLTACALSGPQRPGLSRRLHPPPPAGPPAAAAFSVTCSLVTVATQASSRGNRRSCGRRAVKQERLTAVTCPGRGRERGRDAPCSPGKKRLGDSGGEVGFPGSCLLVLSTFSHGVIH